MNLDAWASQVISTLPDNRIFVDHDVPCDVPSGKRYIAELKRLRLPSTNRRPTHQSLPCTLRLSNSWTYSLQNVSDRVPTYRYRPTLFSSDDLTTAELREAAVTLNQVVRAKRDTHAQVYGGFLHVGPERPREVWVKIYQQSLYSLPNIDFFDKDRNCDDVGLRTARYDAGVEAWAYRKTSPLQGSFIPYSLGFYEIHLPSGENCVVHVIESLHGVPLASFKRRDDLERRLGYRVIDLVENMLEKILLMHELGVIHEDLHPRNIMLLHQDHSPLPSICIINFVTAEPPHPFYDNVHADLYCLLDLLERYRVPIGCVEAWYAKHASSHPHPLWLSLFTSQGGEGGHWDHWHETIRDREERGVWKSLDY